MELYATDVVLHRVKGAGYEYAFVEGNVVHVEPDVHITVNTDNYVVSVDHEGEPSEDRPARRTMGEVMNDLRAIRHPRYGVPTPFDATRAAEIKAKCQAMVKHCGNWSEHSDKVMTPGERAYVIVVWDAMSGSSAWIDAFNRILRGEV